MIVKSELENLGLNAIIVELGEVEIPGNLAPTLRQELKSATFKVFDCT